MVWHRALVSHVSRASHVVPLGSHTAHVLRPHSSAVVQVAHHALLMRVQVQVLVNAPRLTWVLYGFES